MPLPAASTIRAVLSGLGCAAVLSGAVEAARLGAAVWVPYGLLTLALGALWRRRTVAAAPRRAPAQVLRLARSASEAESREASGPSLEHAARRTFWSRAKLWVGGVGFVLSGLWWCLLGALLVMPDPAPALDGLFTSSFLPLVTVSLLVSVLFVVILRSGLRGPADPLVPDQGPTRLRDQPTPPGPGRRAPGRAGGKKSHLRLVVRDTP